MTRSNHSVRNGLVGLIVGPGFIAAALAQAASGPASTQETEAMARARRDAEKVFSWIRKDGETATPTTPQPKRKANDDDDAAAPAKPAPKPAPKAAPKPAPQPVARSAPPAPAPAPAPAKVAAPAAAAAVAAPPAPVAAAARTPELPPALFDFEKSTEGFTANDGYKWGAAPGAEVTLVDKAARGAKALQVKVTKDSWVGRDFEGEDWGGKAYVVFSLQSERGYNGKIGFKTGQDWGWCDAKAVVSGEVKGFTIYRVALESKLCPSLDKRDVRGMHLWINAGDTVTLDNIYLAE